MFLKHVVNANDSITACFVFRVVFLYSVVVTHRLCEKNPAPVTILCGYSRNEEARRVLAF